MLFTTGLNHCLLSSRSIAKSSALDGRESCCGNVLQQRCANQCANQPRATSKKADAAMDLSRTTGRLLSSRSMVRIRQGASVAARLLSQSSPATRRVFYLRDQIRSDGSQTNGHQLGFNLHGSTLGLAFGLLRLATELLQSKASGHSPQEKRRQPRGSLRDRRPNQQQWCEKKRSSPSSLRNPFAGGHGDRNPDDDE